MNPLNQPVKTIAVFLPVGYRGGSLNSAKNIAKMLYHGSRSAKQPVDIVFSCVADTYDIAEEFGDLLALGILVRETTWEKVSKSSARGLSAFVGADPRARPAGVAIKSGRIPGSAPTKTIKPRDDGYTIPVDGKTNFHDCDFWLLISDRLLQPLAPIKPYGMVVFDYIQRYVPEILVEGFSDISFLQTARGADFVLTTTPQTREDAIQYAGVSPQRVHLAPMEFSPVFSAHDSTQAQQNYFIWTSNTAPHKNHLSAIEALELYYGQLDGKLDVFMTGVNTDLFDPQKQIAKNMTPYMQRVREKLERTQHTKQHLHFKGNQALADYAATLSAAQFLWHPTKIDNGTFSVIEAAYCNVPALSSHYPQMHFINERFSLNLSFCDPSQPKDMARQLKKMEEEHISKRQMLPTQATLEKYCAAQLAPEFWHLFRGLI